MSSLTDKMHQALVALSEVEIENLKSVTWQNSIRLSGRMWGKATGTNYALESAKSRIHAVADSTYHAEQIIDLAENRIWLLENIYERLARGDAIEPIIEKLLDGLRHEPESFEEMVEAFTKNNGNWAMSSYLLPLMGGA